MFNRAEQTACSLPSSKERTHQGCTPRGVLGGHQGFINWVFVKVTTEYGIVGYGEAGVALSKWALAVSIQELARLVIGRDPFAIRGLWSEVCKTYLDGRGPSSLHISALGAIEVALWNIVGKALGGQVYKSAGREALGSGSGVPGRPDVGRYRRGRAGGLHRPGPGAGGRGIPAAQVRPLLVRRLERREHQPRVLLEFGIVADMAAVACMTTLAHQLYWPIYDPMPARLAVMIPNLLKVERPTHY